MEELVILLNAGLPFRYYAQAEYHGPREEPSLTELAQFRFDDIHANSYGYILIAASTDIESRDLLQLWVRTDHVMVQGRHFEYCDPAFPENLLDTVLALVSWKSRLRDKTNKGPR